MAGPSLWTDTRNDGVGNLYVTDYYGVRKIVLATRAVTTSVDGTGAPINFDYPYSMAADAAGNLYFADWNDNTILKVVVATGVTTTFAGATGPAGSADGIGGAARFSAPGALAGDTLLAGAPVKRGSADGTGAAARFNSPSGMALDGAGNLYIADYHNNEIRRMVLATRAVTTLAGTLAGGSADGSGAMASFYGPMDVLSDGAGTLYVADTYNYTVRKLVLATGAVTTFAGAAGQADTVDGTGAAARFGDVFGLASDSAGNLYVADGTNVVRKIVVAAGAVTVTTLAGTPGQYKVVDGIGSAARFSGPGGLASDGAGNLYLTDAGTVRKVVLATRAVTTLAGDPDHSAIVDGIGTAARFSGTGAIACDGAGSLYVADGPTIRKVDIASASVSTVIGSPDRVGVSLGALPASLDVAYGVFVLPTGELAIADYVENAILIAHL
jgi:hypothetical protein